MAAAPDDDARRTLAELEAKLRELERELLRGQAPEHPPPSPEPEAPATAPEPSHPDLLASEPFPEAPPPDDGLAHHGDPLGAAAHRAHPEPFPEPRAPEPPAAEPPTTGAQPPEPPVAGPLPDEPLAADTQPAEPLGAPPPPDEPLVADTQPAEPLGGERSHPAPFPEAGPPEPLGADGIAASAGVARPPEPAPPAEPPPPALDLDALADAQEVLAALRATVEGLEQLAGRVTVEARAVVDDHGRSQARLELAARAAARAEEAAAEAGRVAGTVVVEAGPFADPAPLLALRDALAAHPGTNDAYVRGVEDGRAVIEVHLAPPPA